MKIKKTIIQTTALLALICGLSTAIAQDSSGDTAVTTKAPALNQEQVQQVQQVIHDYLLSNPEILVAAGQELQKKQAQQQQNAAMTAISENKQQIFNDPNSPIIGNAQGTILLVEFYDYQCGHCKSMSSTIQSVLSSDNHVKLILKELPIFGGNSKLAAEASLAVYKIDPTKYQEFHEQLLDVEGALSEDKIYEVTTGLGIKTDALKKQMESKSTAEELKNNFQLAQELGIQGTPSFIISNEDLSKFAFIPGATSQENLLAQFKSVE